MRTIASLVVAVSLAAAPACANDESGGITVTRPSGTSALPAETYESTMIVPELNATIRVEGALRDVDGLGGPLIADAQRQVSDTLDAARERRAAARDIFSRWTLSVDWTAKYLAPDLVSALGVTSLVEGAGAPAETFETAVRAPGAEEDLPITEFFVRAGDGGAALTALSDAAFAAWAELSPAVRGDLALVDERTLGDARAALAPRAESFATYALRASESDPSLIGGFELYYPAGALSPRSEGAYRLFISADAVAAHLDPAWADRFAVSSPD